MINKISLILICLMLVGCVSSKSVEHNQYLFNIPQKSSGNALILHKCSIAMAHVVATPPFDQLDFLYRIKSNQYLVDYYNGFLAAPTEQLDSILIEHLKAQGDFNVKVTESPLATNKLQVKLVELYADYRNPSNPQAVVAMNFFLTKLNGDKTVVLLDRVLRESVCLKAKTTESLLQSWNVGIRNILRQSVWMLNQACLAMAENAKSKKGLAK